MTQVTNSFELGNIGADLAYLLGAIILDNGCVWPPDRPLVRLLKQNFDPSHKVWDHLATTDEEIHHGSNPVRTR